MAKTNSGSKIAMRKLDAMPLQAAISVPCLDEPCWRAWPGLDGRRLRGWGVGRSAAGTDMYRRYRPSVRQQNMELRLSLTLCVGGSLPDVANKSFGAIDHASCWSIGKLTLDDASRFLSICMMKSGCLGSPASIFIRPSMISLCIVHVVQMIQCRLLQHNCPINATMPEADMTCGAGCYWSQEDGGCRWSHLYHQYVDTFESPEVTRCHQSHGMMFNDKTRTEGLEMVGASTTSCETQERDWHWHPGSLQVTPSTCGAKMFSRKARFAQRSDVPFFLRCKGPSLRPSKPSHQVWQEGWSVAQVPTRWSLKGLASSLNLIEWIQYIYI